jgi:hypothetical protein
METKDEDYWSFITVHGKYCCDTDRLAQSQAGQDHGEARPGIVAVTRRISFRGEPGNAPDAATLMGIKDALQGNSRRYLLNLEHYQRCQLTLIDVRPGEEI